MTEPKWILKQDLGPYINAGTVGKWVSNATDAKESCAGRITDEHWPDHRRPMLRVIHDTDEFRDHVYQFNDGGCSMRFTVGEMEDNPDWFEKVEEMNNTTNRVAIHSTHEHLACWACDREMKHTVHVCRQCADNALALSNVACDDMCPKQNPNYHNRVHDMINRHHLLWSGEILSQLKKHTKSASKTPSQPLNKPLRKK